MDDKKLAMYELGRYYEEGIKPSEESMKVAIRTLQNAIELEELGKQPVKSNTIAFNVNGHCYGVMGGDKIIGEFEKDFPETKQTEPSEDAISRHDAKLHIEKRLYESGLNNVGYQCDASDVFKDIAENRLAIWLDELPSVNPQIIHCKDCNEWHRGKDGDGSDWYSDEGYCCVHRILTGENYYCGDAERR